MTVSVVSCSLFYNSSKPSIRFSTQPGFVNYDFPSSYLKGVEIKGGDFVFRGFVPTGYIMNPRNIWTGKARNKGSIHLPTSTSKTQSSLVEDE